MVEGAVRHQPEHIANLPSMRCGYDSPVEPVESEIESTDT